MNQLINNINNPEKLKKLLEEGINPNCDNGYDTPLFKAIKINNLEVIRILLIYKANPNILCYDKDGFESMLFYVCRLNNNYSYNICKLLLEYGANPNLGRFYYNLPSSIKVSSDYSCTPLSHLCFYTFSTNVIKLLIDNGAKITSDELCKSVILNNYNTVKLLLDKGADPYERYNGSKNAFDYANNDKMINILNNNKYLLNWLNIMRDESENGILIALKYRPENFYLWKEELDENNSLIKYW